MADDPLMREYQSLLRRSSRPHDRPQRLEPQRSEIVPAQSRNGTVSRASVSIVEDDAALREVLLDLLQSVGLQVKTFSTAMELLSTALPSGPSCFVLDVRLPGLSGLDLQARLVQANVRIPIIFMTGHADVPMTVRAMKAGAFDFLAKPFREQEMLDAVAGAIELDRARLTADRQAIEALTRFETLSQRERDVMQLVTAGLMNKQAAARIGLAESTVKVHRSQVMKRMGAKSLPDLVRMAELLRSMPTPRVSLGAILDKPTY
jgi:FixJ family two-component response regulator